MACLYQGFLYLHLGKPVKRNYRAYQSLQCELQMHNE